MRNVLIITNEAIFHDVHSFFIKFAYTYYTYIYIHTHVMYVRTHTFANLFHLTNYVI